MQSTLVSDRRPPVSLPHSQSLPPIASLTGPLPDHSPTQQRHQPDLRDSGNWSTSQSKHSSGVSNTTGLQLQTILNSSEESPKNIPDTPQSTRYSAHQNALPSLNQSFDPNRQSLGAESFQDSRRSSVDSRMNAGMNHLAISPASPYESQNASRVSLVSTLQQQRGIVDQRSNGTTPLSPLGNRTGPRPPISRQAPVIHPVPRNVSGAPDPMAAAPTKGYAWAFPDDFDSRRRSSSGDSSADKPSRSRQGSFAASVNSSIYTTDSALPPGQKRFDDELSHTHHHSMQHRSVTNLQSDLQSSATGGNYSRTPELRVSHKMAERKRRSEMKSLFDELNGILPNSPGSKSSKWEILTKSIEYIRSLGKSYEATRAENQRLRPDADYARKVHEENELLKNEVVTLWQQLRRLDPTNGHVYGNFTSMLAQQPGPNPSIPHSILPPLPPPTAPPNWQQQPPPSSAMQGVEFGGGRSYDHR
ncbi:hypothetical protein M501DRAFT_987434 [Patellaria atrata CBS 101060]|uniref:BHLH domain-containing protein n=1 Tax=Patellaria atrata CBS 101060 TaxID=1346257 RepID=A0A9P4VP07_9PEZI|nr:hypothetical protein M501DRAFT_987434 [Patellaria atrata CBS 101060]